MTDALRRMTESRLNYRIGYAVDFCCPLVFAYLAWLDAPSWLGAGATLSGGALAFSFVEYAIHRWLFHSQASWLSPFHHTHHAHPEEPTALPCLSSAVIGLALWPLASSVAEPGVAGAFLCGFFGWYFVYALLHHVEHHTRINHLPTRWLQRRWAAHAIHHRRTEANFGVTTALWDRIFGTHYQSARRHGPSQNRAIVVVHPPLSDHPVEVRRHPLVLGALERRQCSPRT